MKRAYAYTRVSTHQQTEKYGLDVQEQKIRKYAEENEVEIVGWFTDKGITGTTIDRDGLQDMFVALKDNKDVKYIIVNDCSRMWRSEEIAGLLRYQLYKMQVDIISVLEPSFSLFTSDPSTFLVNQIMQALATYDRMQINQKLARARRLKATQKGSKACGTAPIGYKWENANIVPDALEAPIIREIFLAYKHYQSFAKVADFCSERGYKTNQGNEFSRQAIKNILSNDFYISVTRYGGNAYNGSHEAIVSKELFAEVQKIMSAKSRNVERKVA